MPKRILAADDSRIRDADKTGIRVVIVTMDSHLTSSTLRARDRLVREFPGLSLEIHAADEWGSDPCALQHCRRAIEHGDIIVVTMLFMEDHYQPLLDVLQKRREKCDAMV